MPKNSSDPGMMGKALHASVTGDVTQMRHAGKGTKMKKKYSGKLDKYKTFGKIIKGGD